MNSDPNALTQDGNSQSSFIADVPAQIGPYRVIELLGQGGMGRVYLAENPMVKRQVALKLMLSERYQGESLARFHQEMEVLAQLEHSGIARLFEAGEVVVGGQEQPWYAMEFVNGVPLDEYVKRENLSVRQIFALVSQIARAMHYAHQRGVIHRDLKPANILVTQDGVPKILDFGIARFTRSGQAEDARVQTQVGQILGTLAYMSPEQLSNSGLVDVRADVYALGVILYELLSGELPVQMRTTDLLELIKELTEAKRRPITSFNKSYRGEVELIVETASARERDQRYESAAAFAEDMERYLQHRPLLASKPSVFYVINKFVRRNRLLTAAIAIALSSLVGATLYSLRAAEQARTALQQAEVRAAQLSRVNAFVADMLSKTDPVLANGKELTMREVLESSVAAFDNLPNDTAIRAAVSNLLAQAFNNIGKFERGLEIADRMLKAMPPEQAFSVEALTIARSKIISLNELGRFPEALTLTDQLIDAAKTRYPHDSMTVVKLRAEKLVTLAYMGKLKEGMELGEELLQKYSTQLALEDEYALPTLRRNVAILMRQNGRLAEALAIHQQSWDDAVKAGKDTNPKSLFDLHSLGMVQGRMGDHEKALASFREAAQRRTKVLGNENPSTLASEASALSMLDLLNRSEGSLDSAKEICARHVKVLGPAHPSTLGCENNYANLLRDAGQLAQAEIQLLETIKRASVQTNLQASSAPVVFRLRNALGLTRSEMGDYRQAKQDFSNLINDAKPVMPEKDPTLADFYHNAADIDLKLNDSSSAKANLQAAITIYSASLGADHKDTLAAKRKLDSLK
jgi:eukaryotic-like serine/threonine-protein kinase